MLVAQFILKVRKHFGLDAPVDTLLSTKAPRLRLFPCITSPYVLILVVEDALRSASDVFAQSAWEIAPGNARGKATASGGGGFPVGKTPPALPPAPAPAASAPAAPAPAAPVTAASAPA